MEIRVPYGRSFLTATLPDHIQVDIIEPPRAAAIESPSTEVYSALDNLLGVVSWGAFSETKSVAIAINDKTRPVPHDQLLPPLMARLAELGIPDEAITFYIAVGTHLPMTADEFPAILPTAALARYRVISHDSEDDDSLCYLDETTRGTPVWANAGFVQSDLKIVVGNIEPHQFVGFSGGVKTAAIGLSGLETINSNHTLMTHPASQLGEYDTNPARQDIEEIGQMMGVHLALNVVLNHDRQIVRALAGEPQAVMRTGIPLSRESCQVAVSQEYAFVISSPGGHPKDINVYQAQKGLAHAVLITKPGGTILLAAACSEGSGSPHYDDWMMGKTSYAKVIETFQAEGFRIGPHKAFQIARDAANICLMSYTALDEAQVRALLLNPVADFQSAVDLALANLRPGERIGILPHASSTIPYLFPAG